MTTRARRLLTLFSNRAKYGTPYPEKYPEVVAAHLAKKEQQTTQTAQPESPVCPLPKSA